MFLTALTSSCEICKYILNLQRVVRQADDFSTMLSLVQYGMKYLPTLIKLFNSFTGGSDGAGSGIGGGGGGLLDIAAGLLGGGTKVESSSGVDPATITNKVDKIEDKIDLVKVTYLKLAFLISVVRVNCS